jgi:hypothetical protein
MLLSTHNKDENIGEGEDDTNFKPNGIVSTYLRLCVEKVWSEMMSGPDAMPFSIPLLLDTETIKKGIIEFNKHSHLWKFNRKTIPLTWLSTISKTAAGWEKDINMKRSKGDMPIEKPRGYCYTDWINKSEQKRWEMYYCTVIAEAKLDTKKASRGHSSSDGALTWATVRKDRKIIPISATSSAYDSEPHQLSSVAENDLNIEGNIPTLNTSMIDFKTELLDAKKEAADNYDKLASKFDVLSADIRALTTVISAELKDIVTVLKRKYADIIEN